ncbi:MAG TPA: DinB family protein [Methylomirabilota bacterium]|nr:DinB family protein [Methylomirabilota bacterium]
MLAQRVDIVLDTTQQLIRSVPDHHLDWRPPERNRTFRNLGYHVFRLSLAFVDGMDLGEFPESWLLDEAPADLKDGEAIARYGALVRGRISGWFEGASPGEFERVIKVYYGPQSGHDLLERTAWHGAQHLRQLYVLCERLGIRPPVPMPTHAFEGLPLPDALW